MNTELRNRLEEAADKYALGMYDEAASRTGFMHGAEYGYKEANALAKKWILNNVHKYEGINGTIFHQSMADDFEADVNKLLKEK